MLTPGNAPCMLKKVTVTRHAFMNTLKKKLSRHAVLIFSLISMNAITGCRDRATAVSITAYNHTKNIYIGRFYVDGIMGPNVYPESGGGETCCVQLPNVWRPGLSVRIWWEYDGLVAESIPPSPPAEIVVPIPEYKIASRVQVHFYQKDVKVVVSPCTPDHPYYPMSKIDLAPWAAIGTRVSMKETVRRGGGSIDC